MFFQAPFVAGGVYSPPVIASCGAFSFSFPSSLSGVAVVGLRAPTTLVLDLPSTPYFFLFSPTYTAIYRNKYGSTYEGVELLHVSGAPSPSDVFSIVVVPNKIQFYKNGGVLHEEEFDYFYGSWTHISDEILNFVYGFTNSGDSILVNPIPLIAAYSDSSDVLYTHETSLLLGSGQAEEYAFLIDYYPSILDVIIGLASESAVLSDLSLLSDSGEGEEKTASVEVSVGVFSYLHSTFGLDLSRLVDEPNANRSSKDTFFSYEVGSHISVGLSTGSDGLTVYDVLLERSDSGGDFFRSYEHVIEANSGVGSDSSSSTDIVPGSVPVYALNERIFLFSAGSSSISNYPAYGSDTNRFLDHGWSALYSPVVLTGYLPYFYAFTRQGFVASISSVVDTVIPFQAVYVGELSQTYTGLYGLCHLTEEVLDTSSLLDASGTAYVQSLLNSVTLSDGFKSSISSTFFDASTLLDSQFSAAKCLAAVTLTAAILDAVARGASEQISDTGVFLDAVRASFVIRAQEICSLLDTPIGAIRFILDLSDTVLPQDHLSAAAVYSYLIQDGVTGVVSVNLGADQYFGYVLSTHEPQPISTYSNYPFTSLASFGGRYYATAEDGVYQLFTSDTDAGQPIQAAIKTLLFDFVATNLKSFQTAYFGMTSSGKLLLKVKVTDPDGRLVEVVYEVQPSALRTKLGKGLRGRYWQFELVNVDGADFDLDTIEFHPVLLSRRVFK